MIIESTDQVPRAVPFERFPVPRNLGAAHALRTGRGKIWYASGGTTHVKTFKSG